MLRFVPVLTRSIWAVAYSWRDPESRGLVALSGVMPLAGALFYRQIEGWSSLNSLYFSVATLTSVGYGDLSRDGRRQDLHDLLHTLRHRHDSRLRRQSCRASAGMRGGESRLRRRPAPEMSKTLAR